MFLIKNANLLEDDSSVVIRDAVSLLYGEKITISLLLF